MGAGGVKCCLNFLSAEAAPDAKALARERIAHSDYKRIIELSNPSLPDYGVDEQFQKSDQRHWTIKCEKCGEWTALDKEFPTKLNKEVKIILPRPDGTWYRACKQCGGELDLSNGEWVADYSDRDIHGYRISQLFSVKVDPGEIVKEYRTTRYPDRFFNMKVGIPWADLERRLDQASVLSLCATEDPELNPDDVRILGVDTGRALHAVILQRNPYSDDQPIKMLHIGAYRDFSDLDMLIKRFDISQVVIDGLPETHATRDFASRHDGVFLCFFNDHQKGVAKWSWRDLKVEVNRTEALDASKEAIRQNRVILPRRLPIVEEFARHMTADAKILDEDEETGIKKYRYVRTGENHFSMAFTYAWMAATNLQFPVAYNY